VRGFRKDDVVVLSKGRWRYATIEEIVAFKVRKKTTSLVRREFKDPWYGPCTQGVTSSMSTARVLMR